MLFACLTAPTRAARPAWPTPPAVLDALPADLVDRFEREGWLLTRTYNDEIGASLGRGVRHRRPRAPSSATAGPTRIEFAWQPDGGLRTRQRRRAVVRHPVTGRRCWFNQIAFLNEWTMDPEVREFLVDVYGPTGCRSTPASATATRSARTSCALLNEVYEAHTVREPWQAGRPDARRQHPHRAQPGALRRAARGAGRRWPTRCA